MATEYRLDKGSDQERHRGIVLEDVKDFGLLWWNTHFRTNGDDKLRAVD